MIPAHLAVRLPDEVAFEQAAAVMLKGMTAQVLVKRIHNTRPEDTVLFQAATSGVGLIACQWLKHLGARVIGAVSSTDKVSLAREHGCDHVIVYTQGDIESRVVEITGGAKVPVIFDSLGAANFLKSLDCIQPRGARHSLRAGVRPGRTNGSQPAPVEGISLRHATEPQCVHGGPSKPPRDRS